MKPKPVVPRLVEKPSARDLAALDARPSYVLKVTLADIDPPIWRRLRVRADTSLFVLHRILQRAMPWQDYHLHQFLVGDLVFGSRDDEFGQDIISDRSTQLRVIAPNAKTRFVYEYDFGDCWRHEIVVEEILPPDPTMRCPECLDGARACPPEDVGGTDGYQHFLEALRIPDHPERDEYLEWIGGAFDSEAFDLAGINQRLRRLRSPA